MNRLVALRHRLQSLRSARAGVRWGAALLATLSFLVASWLVLGLLDWSLRWSFAARVVVLVLWGTGVAAWWHRRIWPEVANTESLEDVALVVEREHSIDSDLIAALQFDAQTQPAWGSSRLSSAVVEYVAEYSRSLDVFRGFQWGALPGRALMFGGLTVAALLCCCFWPGHVSAFWNRFWLGAARYPTQTQIASLVINGREIPVHHGEAVTLPVAQGQSFSVQVLLQGDTQVPVIASVVGLQSGERTDWNFPIAATSAASATSAAPNTSAAGPAIDVLTTSVPPSTPASPSTPPVKSDPLENLDDVGSSALSTGTRVEHQVAQLSESVRVMVRAGDAESDPVVLRVLPLPIVDLTWTATPPAYARGGTITAVAPGARQFAALQGSTLTLQVVAVNKRLSAVKLQLGEQSTPLVMAARSDGERWELPADSPLKTLQETVRYELTVVDEDGLQPEPPIMGEIRLQTDRLPRIAAAVVSHRVLPTAVPKVNYGATDDFGLKSIRWQIEVVRSNGQLTQQQLPLWTSQNSEAPAPGSGQRTVRGDASLDLKPWSLTKGDEIRVTLIAEDERGAFPAGVGQSETLIFEVTDRNGILDSLLEIDQQSAKHLDEIIERELGIGRTSR